MILDYGKVAKVKFELKDQNGDKIDSDESIEFVYGVDEIFTEASTYIESMEVGDVRVFVVPQDEGYGPIEEELVTLVPKTEIDDDYDTFKMGEFLTVVDPDTGEVLFGEIIEKRDDGLVIDFNHQLAGKDLHYTFELLSVRDATDDERENGIINKKMDELYAEHLSNQE